MLRGVDVALARPLMTRRNLGWICTIAAERERAAFPPAATIVSYLCASPSVAGRTGASLDHLGRQKCNLVAQRPWHVREFSGSCSRFTIRKSFVASSRAQICQAIFFLAAGFLVATAIVLLCINLYLQSDGVQQRIRDAALRSLGTEIKIRSTMYTPWSGLVLRGISVADPTNANLNIVEATALRVRFSLARS